MFDFQTKLAELLKERKANENNQSKSKTPPKECVPFWYYHVFLSVKEDFKNTENHDTFIEIYPRGVITKAHQDSADPLYATSGYFATIAVDRNGRFGFVVCSHSDNFCRKDGRRRALGKLMAAQGQNVSAWGPTNFYHYSFPHLREDNLRELVGNALVKFLLNGSKRRSK
jgi:hypothetical protein